MDGWAAHPVRVRLGGPDLSLDTYCIPVGGQDGQQPHTDSGETEVGPGSVVFVPADETHRFTDVSEDLAVFVVFGPAEYSRA